MEMDGERCAWWVMEIKEEKVAVVAMGVEEEEDGGEEVDRGMEEEADHGAAQVKDGVGEMSRGMAGGSMVEGGMVVAVEDGQVEDGTVAREVAAKKAKARSGTRGVVRCQAAKHTMAVDDAGIGQG